MAKDNPKKTCALCHEARTLSHFLFIVLRGIKRYGTVCAICRGKKPQDDSNDAQPPSLSQRQAALVFFVDEEGSGGWDPEDRAKQKKHHQSLDSKTLAKRLKNAQKQKKKRRQAKKKQNHHQQRELENTDTHESSEHDKDSRDTIKTRKNQAFGVSQQPYIFPQKQHAAAQESTPKKEAAHKTQSKKASASDNAAPSEQTEKEKVDRHDKEHKRSPPPLKVKQSNKDKKKQITKDKTSKPSARDLATDPSQSMDPKQMRDDGVLGIMYRNKATVGPTLSFAKWLSKHNSPHSQPQNRSDNDMREELDAIDNEQKQVRSTAQSLWQFRPQ